MNTISASNATSVADIWAAACSITSNHLPAAFLVMPFGRGSFGLGQSYAVRCLSFNAPIELVPAR